jgi:hypothetical protein
MSKQIISLADCLANPYEAALAGPAYVHQGDASGVVERATPTFDYEGLAQALDSGAHFGDSPHYEWQVAVVTTECSYTTIATANEAQARACLALHRASADTISAKLLRRTVVVEEVV